LLTTKDKVMELLIFKAEIFTKAPGKKAKWTEEEHSLLLKAIFIKGKCKEILKMD
jgi:hypothetical protein